MDKGSLVNFGFALAEAMDANDMAPRGLMWVNNTDTQTWKLWVVPPASLTDRREFYRRLATIITSIRDKFPSFDISDIEMMTDKHPVIIGMAKMFRVEGLTDVTVTGVAFDGFYIPDGIVLRLNV
jgi:hypothetical protein